jgi:hypothetical protein
MNEVENGTPLADRMMMGPDGEVYDLRTGTSQESPDDLNSAGSPRLPQHASDGGLGGGCFAYSAEAPRRDGGTIGGCFRFSADVPRRDGGVIGGGFRFSADVPREAPGQGSPCFRFLAETAAPGPRVIDPCFAYGAAPRCDGGTGSICFVY